MQRRHKWIISVFIFFKYFRLITVAFMMWYARKSLKDQESMLLFISRSPARKRLPVTQKLRGLPRRVYQSLKHHHQLRQHRQVNVYNRLRQNLSISKQDHLLNYNHLPKKSRKKLRILPATQIPVVLTQIVRIIENLDILIDR